MMENVLSTVHMAIIMLIMHHANYAILNVVYLYNYNAILPYIIILLI